MDEFDAVFRKPQYMKISKKQAPGPTRRELITRIASDLNMTYTEASKDAEVRRALAAYFKGPPKKIRNKRDFSQKKRYEGARAFFATTYKEQRFWTALYSADSEIVHK